jgi:hypothetical protein
MLRILTDSYICSYKKAQHIALDVGLVAYNQQIKRKMCYKLFHHLTHYILMIFVTKIHNSMRYMNLTVASSCNALKF